METRSNWLMVSLTVGFFIIAAIAFVLWLRQAQYADGPTYEIRFERSVAGVQEGSVVSMLGVPVGRVSEVRLEPANPGLVLVRFELTRDVPLRRGVSASIKRSLLDGSATISLEGGDKRAPALTAQSGQPFPVVPAKGGGPLGGDLDPAALIAKISSQAESISEKLDAQGQRDIEQSLGDLARRSQSWNRAFDREAEKYVRPDRIGAFGRAVARAGEDAERLHQRLDASRGSRDTLVRPLHRAERAAESVGQSFERARPDLRQLDEDARQVTGAVGSIREPVQRVGEAAKKIDREGMRPAELPDFDASRAN